MRTLLAEFRRGPAAVRLAVTLWAVLLVGVGVRVAFAGPQSQSVVPIYRTAALNWRAGADPYTYYHPLDVYRNPPGFAATFAPLTLLPEKTASILWRGLGAVVFLLGLRAFARDALPPLSDSQIGLLFAVAAPLALPSVNNGQVNVLLTGAVLLGAAAAARGRAWPAAGWLGFAAWLKLYPLAAGLLLGLVFPRLFARLGAVLAAGFAVPFLLAEPGYVLDAYRNFVKYLGTDDRTYSFLSQVPRDWTIVSRQWFDVVPAPATRKLVAVAAALLAAGLVWRTAPPVPTVAGLALVWMTLFGPATENHTYTLLVPVAAAAAVTWRGWAAVAGWLAVGLLLAVVLRPMFPTSEVLPVRTTAPVGAAVLLVGLVAEALGRRVVANPTVVIADRIASPIVRVSSAASASAPGSSR